MIESTVSIQLLGAAYFSLSLINWTARANLIGGIYGRPIAIGNFTHFGIGAISLVKVCLSNSIPTLLGSAIIYTLFAIGFGIVVFTHPLKKDANAQL
jgi:hypothetical protein